MARAWASKDVVLRCPSCSRAGIATSPARYPTRRGVSCACPCEITRRCARRNGQRLLAGPRVIQPAVPRAVSAFGLLLVRRLFSPSLTGMGSQAVVAIHSRIIQPLAGVCLCEEHCTVLCTRKLIPRPRGVPKRKWRKSRNERVRTCSRVLQQARSWDHRPAPVQWPREARRPWLAP